MHLYNFCLNTIKLKSSWFGEGENTYKKMGKEEGLNLYLQLFRFRLYQGERDEHLFRTSLLELRKFTKVNMSRRLTIDQIKEMLLLMESVGVIKIHSPLDKMKGDEMLIIEASDVPKTERVDGKDAIVNGEYYVPVNFKTVEYMYGSLEFTSKEVSFYILLSMYGLRKGNSKTNMKINKMRERLGTRNDSILDMLKKFNETGLAYTIAKKDGNKTNFEHYICKNIDNIEKFKEESKEYRDKFLGRYDGE